MILVHGKSAVDCTTLGRNVRARDRDRNPSRPRLEKTGLETPLLLTSIYVSSKILFYALSCRKEWPKISTKPLKAKNICSRHIFNGLYMFNVDMMKGNSVKGIKQQRQEKPAQRL